MKRPAAAFLLPYAVLAAFAALTSLAGCQPSASAAAAGNGNTAVLVELATASVPMKPGNNHRMFNRMFLAGQDFARYDSAAGSLKLAPGTYRIDAYSITTFGYQLTKPQRDSADIRSIAGYAYLCNIDSDSIVSLGSMQDAIFSMPSVVTDVISVTRPTNFYLGHQNGNDVVGVMLETYVPKITTSINHAMANIVVQRLSDRPGPPRPAYASCNPPPPPPP